MGIHPIISTRWVVSLLVVLLPFYPSIASNWTADLHNPEDIIKNQGQYNGLFPSGKAFVIDYGFGWQAGLGGNGAEILIRTSHFLQASESTQDAPSTLEQRITADWVGLAAGHFWEGNMQRQAYYTFGSDEQDKDYSRVPSYGEVWLRQAWAGVDIRYTSPRDGGMKYTLFLAPNASLSPIRLRYAGADVQLDSEGNLRMATLLGDLVDHAPTAHYADGLQEALLIRFVVTGQEIGFEITGRDPSRPLVIDPWTVNPALPAPFNRAFEVDYDNAGNVFVFGGGMGYNLKKYNAAGTLQWTHVSPWDTSNSWFGELLVLGAGDVFITSGSAAKIRRLTAAGATTFTNNGPFFNLDEYWTLTLNCDRTKLISGGSRIVGFTSPQGHVFDLNMSNGNQITGSPYNVSPAFMKEIRALCTGANGNLYLLSNDNVIALNQTFGIIYSVSSGYAYPYYSPSYMANSVQGQNTIDADANFIYTMNGPNLHKRAIATGGIVATAAIPGGGATGGFGGSGAFNGGLRIDNCSNIYVGSTNAVYKFNSTLGVVTSVATSGPVYDVEVAPGGVVIIGGSGFLTSNTSLAPCAIKTISCVILDGEVSQFEVECDNGVPVWSWEAQSADLSFEVEISRDGQSWQKVAEVAEVAAQTGKQLFQVSLPYALQEAQPIYSRLKISDMNGNFSYSGVKTLESCLEENGRWDVYPSHSEGLFTLSLETEQARNADWQLFDALGRRVKRGKLSLTSGIQTFPLDFSSLSAGIYYLKITGFEGFSKLIRE